MLKNPHRQKIKWALNLIALSGGFVLIFFAKQFFESPEARRVLQIFSGNPSGPQWQWCPKSPSILYKSSNINILSDADLEFLCSVEMNQVTTDEARGLSKQKPLLKVGGEGHKVSILKADPTYSVFEIDGLPFKNASWTQFFKTKDTTSSP